MFVTLNSLGEIITGNTPSKKNLEYWDSEDICFVKPDIIHDTGITKIIGSNEYISEIARSKARIVKENAVFVTCIGNIGKIGIAGPGEYAFNQQINVIVPNEKIKSKYLAYCILYNKPKLSAISNAPVVPIINKNQFGEFVVSINPDLDIQNEIITTLSRIETIIEARKRELQKLDDLIKARLVEMFGDYHTNSKGFETYPGIELFKFSSGKFLPEEKRLSDGIPVYGGNGIAWYTDVPLIDYPTIIIGRVGALCGNIHTVHEPVWITDNAIYIKEQKTDM